MNAQFNIVCCFLMQVLICHLLILLLICYQHATGMQCIYMRTIQFTPDDDMALCMSHVKYT